jgi:hypothetical protein
VLCSGSWVFLHSFAFLLLLPDGRHGARTEGALRHEAKKIRDIAKASADLIKQQNLSHEAYLDAMELKLWAEARVGQFLKEKIRHEGGRPSKLCTNGTVLPEEISRRQSSNWQALADAIDEIPAHMEKARAGLCNPAAAPLIKLAKKRRAPVIWGTTPSRHTRG